MDYSKIKEVLKDEEFVKRVFSTPEPEEVQKKELRCLWMMSMI